MPETVAAYIATATLTEASVLTFSQILAATYVATAVVVVGYSNQQRRKAERKARDAANASLSDRNITTRGTLEVRQLVMGRVRTGGTIVFLGSTGANKEKLTMVIALASHRIQAVEQVYFGDEALTLDGDGRVIGGAFSKSSVESSFANMTLVGGAGSVTLPHTPLGTPYVSIINGDAAVSAAGTVAGNTVSVTGFGGGLDGSAIVQYQYVVTETATTSRARVRWMLGGDDQAAFPDLVAQFPDEWTANHRLRGIAYLVVELDFDADIYPAGVPNVSAVIRGTDEVYDPRTGTTGYSANPALLMRWYLLHRFGGRRTAAQLDDASFIEAANACDLSVNYGDGATPIYLAGTVARADQTPGTVCDELAEAMAGRWGYSSGVIRTRAGAIGAAVAAMDESWLAGSINVQPKRPRAELGNVMSGSFVDPASGWQQVPFPRVPSDPGELAALLAEDGGTELVQDVEFAAVNRAGQAQQVAATLLREARQSLTVVIECNMKAYSLQLFDTVSLTLDRYGWDVKLFEVVGRSFTLGGAIRLTLRETGSAIYAFGTSFGTTDPIPNTSLPNPFIVPQMGAITATSGAAVLPDNSVVSRVQLTWAAPADAGVTQGGYIELSYRDASTSDALQTVRADSYTGHTLVGLRGGRAYVFQVRAVNGLGVRGKYGPQTLHTVYLVRGPKTFRQATAPANPADDVRDEDRWSDIDDGMHPYVRAAGVWVSVRDATIAAAQADADAAAAAAAVAQGDANTANSVLADIASDSVLTPDEKPRVIQDYTVILAEQTGIDGQATNYGVTTEKTTYDAAVSALTTYLGTLTSPVTWNNLAGNTAIVGATFRGKFADVYTTRQALLDAINAAAKARLGALATLNTVGTPQIAANAATEVTEVSASAVTITGVQGSGPQGYNTTARWTPIATISFTAAITGNVSLVVTATIQFSGAPTIYVAKLACETFINADFNNDTVVDADERLIEDFIIADQPGTGICNTATLTASLQRAVASGVSYSWPVYAQKLEGTLVVQRFYARVEQIKR